MVVGTGRGEEDRRPASVSPTARRFPRRSLTVLQTGVLVATALAFVVVVLVAGTIWSIETERTRIRALQDNTLGAFEDGLAQALWQFDAATAYKILDGMTRFDVVETARVFDDTGRQFAVLEQNGEPVPRDGGWIADSLFGELAVRSRPLYMDVRVGERTDTWEIGHIEITLDTARTAKRLLGQIGLLALQLALLLILFAVVASIAVDRFVTRHLRQLATDVSESEIDGDSTTLIAVPPRHEGNELGGLISRVNDLIARAREATHLQAEMFRQEAQQAALNEANARLESQVAERTEELRRQMERVEFASRSKSIFLASMSHELRTPLNGILGYAEVIRDGLFGPIQPDAYRDCGANIADAGRHMLDLIDEVLTFSETEFGRIGLEEVEADLGGLIDESIALVRPQANRNGIDVDRGTGLTSLKARVDRTKVRQMLVNLLGNSLKYTATDGRVVVDLALRDDGGARIVVRDTGRGIEPDRLDSVLEPFVSSGDPMRNEGGGLGLGLPLTKRIVEAHGGALTLQSQIGRGTTVTLDLPASRTMPST